MSLIGSNDIEVEVTANNTENIPTAEFTNNKTGIISIPVRKVWVGPAAKDVTVHLLADGEIIQSIILSQDNNWRYTFKDLPMYDSTDGHEIVYTVSEKPIWGYRISISGNMRKGFVITNTETPPDNPKTGEAGLPLNIWMMILSGIGMIGIILTGKKKIRLRK
jgi:LPXTG-motif cell wall-anchored protein